MWRPLELKSADQRSATPERDTRRIKDLDSKAPTLDEPTPEICLDPESRGVVSLHLMEMGAEIMATKSAPGKVGRPKATVQLKSITVNLDPTLISAIERARVRREKAVPGVSVNLTDAVRALLMKAIASEEQAEPQAELPLPLESSTKKS